MASSTDPWVREYNEASKLADDITSMISASSSLGSGPEAQRHSSATRRKITILGTRLDSLQSLLTKLPAKQPLTEKEMNKRRDMLTSLRTKVAQMASSLNMSNFGTRDSLLRPDTKPPDAMSRTTGLDNSGIVGLQRQIMREQDEGLGKLEETVISTKHIALAVNEELNLHTRLIDDLDEHVDVTDSRLKRVQRHLAILNKRTKGSCSCLGMLLSVIGIVVLVVAIWMVAQLALKHRQNKKQQQRIIVFAGGPVKYDKKVLEMIGKKLKKNSVALDVVNFGEEDESKSEKLEALVAAVNNNDSSHIVHVPAGSNALSDVLLSTPIFTGDGEGGSGFAAAAAAAAAGGVSGFDFGVDPNLDPELALALRVSMEEERARQEAAAKKAADDSSKNEGGESSSQDATMSENVGTSENKKDDLMDDENALLQQALAMSMDDPAAAATVTTRDADMSEAAADDQDLALALQLSVEEGGKDGSGSGQADMGKLLADQSFVSSILASLPGVDPNDPSVKDLLASMQNQPESDQKKEEDKAPKEDDK